MIVKPIKFLTLRKQRFLRYCLAWLLHYNGGRNCHREMSFLELLSDLTVQLIWQIRSNPTLPVNLICTRFFNMGQSGFKIPNIFDLHWNHPRKCIDHNGHCINCLFSNYSIYLLYLLTASPQAISVQHYHNAGVAHKSGNVIISLHHPHLLCLGSHPCYKNARFSIVFPLSLFLLNYVFTQALIDLMDNNQENVHLF